MDESRTEIDGGLGWEKVRPPGPLRPCRDQMIRLGPELRLRTGVAELPTLPGQ